MSTEQQTTEALRFTNMAQVRKANRDSGQKWFSPETMRYFESSVAKDGLYVGRYFITREVFRGSQETDVAWTIREAQSDGRIETVGEFMAYPTLAAARHALVAIIAAQS